MVANYLPRRVSLARRFSRAFRSLTRVAAWLLRTELEIAQKVLVTIAVQTVIVRFQKASRQEVRHRRRGLYSDRFGYNRRMEKRFGSTTPFTVGLEEEFQLVDPSTRELAPAVEEVIRLAPDGSEWIARELFQD